MCNGAGRAILLLAFISVFPGAQALGEEAGMVKRASGAVSIKRGSEAIAAAPGERVLTADQVTTGESSTVGIVLRDNTLLTAGPNSVLSLDRFSFDPKTQAGALEVDVKHGTLSVISGKLAKSSPENVKFKTANVTLGVRGTEFIIETAGAR